MKLGSVAKLDKRNKTISKYFDDDLISKHCDVIAIFPISGQFGAIPILGVYSVKFKYFN